MKNFSFPIYPKNTLKFKKPICHRNVKIANTHVVFGDINFLAKFGKVRLGLDIPKTKITSCVFYGLTFKGPTFHGFAHSEIKNCLAVSKFFPRSFHELFMSLMATKTVHTISFQNGSNFQ